MHPDWQGRIIVAIREAEAPLPKKHLISMNYALGAAKVDKPHPEVSLYNFHAGKPEAITLNYDLGKAIGDNETGGSARDDTTYRIEGWEFILAGRTSCSPWAASTSPAPRSANRVAEAIHAV